MPATCMPNVPMDVLRRSDFLCEDDGVNEDTLGRQMHVVATKRLLRTCTHDQTTGGCENEHVEGQCYSGDMKSFRIF